MRRDPLPHSVVRDLLGIVRALYAATKAEQPHAERRLETLRRIGLRLRQALELSEKCAPGTLGHSAAWSHAEKALELLSHQVDVTTPLLPLVESATARVRGGAVRTRQDKRSRH